MKFNNINVLDPLHGNNLSKELKKHDIYITASENEPSKSSYGRSIVWITNSV